MAERGEQSDGEMMNRWRCGWLDDDVTVGRIDGLTGCCFLIVWLSFKVESRAK